MAVTNGTLTNAVGATLLVDDGYGHRYLRAELDNQGSLVVEQDLTLIKDGATHVNSGFVELTTGSLYLQGQDTPSFTNTGTMDVADGTKFAIYSCRLNVSRYRAMWKLTAAR